MNLVNKNYNRLLLAASIGILFALAPMSSSATSIKSFEIGSMARIIRQHASKPFIIHFWSLDCAPCVDELPSWSEVTRKITAVDVILVSTDSISNRENIVDFLQASGLSHLPSWVFSGPSFDQLQFDIDRTWYGELPRTYFYSSDGQVTAVSGTISSMSLKSRIRKLARRNNRGGKEYVFRPDLH